MRLIDSEALCKDLLERWDTADTKKEELIQAVMADIVTPIIACQPTVANIPISYIYKVRNRFTDQIGYITHLIDEVWCNIVWEDGHTESYKHLSKVEVIEECT